MVSILIMCKNSNYGETISGSLGFLFRFNYGGFKFSRTTENIQG